MNKYLTFKLSQNLYALEVNHVQEIVALPKLICIANMSQQNAGLMNYHGDFVQIIDLASFLGIPQKKYQLNTCVMLINVHNHLIGLLVDEIISIEVLESEKSLKSQNFKTSYGVKDIKKKEDKVILVLDLETIHGDFNLLKTESTNVISNENWPQDEEADQIFSERAKNLSKALEIKEKDEMISLVIFTLNNEYFGIDPILVKEFHEIPEIVPLPTKVKSIVGFSNLRGHATPIIDIKHLLSMHKNVKASDEKIIEICVEQFFYGILVDSVEGLIQVRSIDQNPIPLGVKSGTDLYLKGTFKHEEKLIVLMDLIKMFKNLYV